MLINPLVGHYLLQQQEYPLIELETRRRDPKTGQTVIGKDHIDPRRTAIVIIDAWEYHWCNTWCGLAGGRIPRLDRALRSARDLGFTIIHSPTDIAPGYVGTPQRERIAALPRMTMPGAPLALPSFPEGEGGPRSLNCLCSGTHCCTPNYGQLNNDPRIFIGPDDLISGDGIEVYTWCKTHGITHLIICGFATNICMSHKPEGVVHMTHAGMTAYIARDMTEAHGTNTGAESADRYTATCVDHLEKHGSTSIELVAALRKAGKWDESWVVDPVRIVPWGLPRRACIYDKPLKISMTFPLHPEAKIYYTTDGSEPTRKSAAYTAPFMIEGSCVIRASAFSSDGKCVSIPVESHYIRRSDAPPKPDVYLSDLQPTKMLMWGWAEKWSNALIGSDPPPQFDRAYRGGPLTLHGVRYGRGLSVQAPAQLLYALEPRFARFVAQVGIDEGILIHDLGRGVASFPSVEFKVFIDGKQAAISPIMRIGAPPWRFDIPIPQGAKTISLVSGDAGDGNREDIANWIDAGFVLRE